MFAQILSLITPALATLFAGLFAFLWLRDRSRLHVLGFAVGYTCFVASFVLVIVLFDGRSVPVSVAVNMIAGSGSAAISWSVARRTRQPSPLLAYGAIILVSSVLVAFAAMAGKPSVLLLAQNNASALITALGALVLWQAGSRRTLDRAMVWVMALLAAHGLTRPLQVMLFEGAPASLDFGLTALQAINVVLMGLFSSAIAMLFLATIVRDDMDRERAEAMRDQLSGLPSRAAFERQAKALFYRAQEEALPVSLLVCDIDHFKAVNDTWGHSAGDKVIAAFGHLISDKIRPDDCAGRVGGEEFCVLVWNCDERGAASLADRLRISFAAAPIDGVARDHRFTASFGVAQWLPGETYANVFVRADAALYTAKRGGRNMVRTASSLSATAASPLTDRWQEPNAAMHADVVTLLPIDRSPRRKSGGAG